jgi:hypothetical protein
MTKILDTMVVRVVEVKRGACLEGRYQGRSVRVFADDQRELIARLRFLDTQARKTK